MSNVLGSSAASLGQQMAVTVNGGESIAGVFEKALADVDDCTRGQVLKAKLFPPIILFGEWRRLGS